MGFVLGKDSHSLAVFGQNIFAFESISLSHAGGYGMAVGTCCFGHPRIIGLVDSCSRSPPMGWGPGLLVALIIASDGGSSRLE